MRRSARRTASSSSGVDDVALEVEPLGDAVAPAARADRRRRREGRVPDVLLVAAADLDLVAVALAGDEPGHRAGHLDHRVVGGRGAVDDERRCARAARRASSPRAPRAAARPPSTPSDWSRGVVGCLSSTSAPSRDQHQVGEGAADVDADAVGWDAPRGRGYTERAPGHKGTAVTVSLELDRLDDEVDHCTGAEHPHRDRACDHGLHHQSLEVADGLDRRAVQLEQQVAGAEAGARGRGSRASRRPRRRRRGARARSRSAGGSGRRPPVMPR